MASSITNRPFEGIRVEVKTTLSVDTVLSRLRGLVGHATVPEVVGLASKVSSEEEYVRQVQERFVGESGFMFFAEIDHGAWISRFGIHRRLIRWILGNPLIAITMLREDLSAGLFAPVELLVIEDEDADGCTVIYVRPSSLISIDPNNSGLLSASKALDEKFAALIDRATAD